MKRPFIGAAAIMLGLGVTPAIIRRLDHARSGDGAQYPRYSGCKDVMEGLKSQDGTALHVECLGNNGPTVIFAHGWTCNHGIFHHQVSHLCDRYRVVVYDQRGHGRSALPSNRDFRIDRLAEDMKAVVDAVDPEEFVIAGHSMGGFTAFKFHEHYGKAYRGRLKGMLIIDSTGTDALESIYLSPLVRRLYPFPLSPLLVLGGRQSRLAEAGRELLRNTSYAYLICRWAAFGKKPPADEVELQREMTFTTPVPVTSLAAKACFDYSAREHLPDVDVPVLMFVGTKDKLTCERANRRTCELLPDARLIVYKDAGHSTHLERTEELNAEVDAFLEACFGG